MRRLHLIVGIVGILAFIGTGQYMAHVHHRLQGMADGPRMLYRSTHLYILLTSLINTSLGIYLRWPTSRWRQVFVAIGSIIFLLAPVAILIGFAIEPSLSNFDRPYSRPALIGSFVGMSFHFLAAIGRRD